ncbi:SusC/RagA family TonB-linked outer membrane protein, partial [Arachidicoccus sp.]|uniref:SusC/RagA family TonB-linked outer membrane protein n=1 Tax=Arachidicoccus sp. TaxID=1872624 RepID=UPI003D213C13
NYRRYSYNINLDVDATPTTKLALSVSGAFENTSSIDASTPILQLFKSLLKYVPIQTLKYTNGDYAGSAGNTPYGLLNSGGYYHKDQTTELMSVSVDQKIPFIPGLSIKGAFSYDPYEYKEKGWHRPYYYYSINTTTNPYTYSQAIATSESYATQTTSLYENYYNNNSFTYQGFLNYHRSFGKSEVTGLVVAEERNNVQSNFGASLNNFQINIDELNFGSSSPTDRGLNGSSSTGSQVGYVYRVDYGYDNKYLFEASGRYDGHYYFAPGHRYAYFPAFSVGWVLSKEKFMKSLSFVNLLKLRASWGKAGNLAGGPFEYLSGYTLYGNSYAFGSGNVVQGSYQAQEANPNLTWEISTKRDIGLEATLWNGLLNIDADYFTERRTGMLLAPSVTVPVEYGLTLAQENAGVMDNHGFELTLQSHHTFRNGLALGLSGNFSYSMNKMVQIYESPSTYDNPNRRLTGRELGEVFGYKAIKLFKTSDDKNNDGIIDSADGYNVTQFGALHPGDVQYADINHDGKIDADDQVPIGDPNYPAITFGFTPTLSWKGVDISVLFQGEAMESFNINGFQTVPFLNNNSNTAYQYYNNRWTPTNQNALYPRATQAPYSNNTQTSSLWVMNTGYIRLKTATLGYTFPSSLLKKSGLSHLRVYVAAQNFLTFSKLKYMDPEIGYTNGELSYPNQKTFIGGLSVSF